MGFRDRFRRRHADDGGGGTGGAPGYGGTVGAVGAVGAPVSVGGVVPRPRHQADPATGELMRVEISPDPVPSDPPPSEPPPSEPPPSEPPPSEPAPSDPAAGFGPAAVYGPRPSPSGGPRPSDPDRTVAAAADPDPVPARERTTPPAAGIVVGQADRRRAALVMPATYSPLPRPYDRSVVREAWQRVADHAGGPAKLVGNFYAELFLLLGDEAFGMFPAGMTAQREDFGRALVQWVVADDPDALSAHLAQLGADHRKFAVEPRHYDVAGTALVNAWRGLLGEHWTPEVERAVLGSYTRLASIMIDGALAHRDEPASWGATVVGHERPLRDFAVLRLQPDEPYLFKAGQYLTVELASRPHEWRRMSVASAPRADNTLDLQVRAVDATGVSAALVMHTAVGDRVRLGPPRGNDLVVEPGTVGPGGLLCVCAGTGAAPVTAVVESLLARPDTPPVHVFVGARTAADLYPAEQLARAVDAAGRADQVQVHGVVAQDPGYTGLRGKVEDVVPTLKDWAQLGVDVLVSGPDTMISTTIFGLVGRGVLSSRIHFDQYDADTARGVARG
ncbi:globin domain-containing protein [Jatrophihabitans fulvus]